MAASSRSIEPSASDIEAEVGTAFEVWNRIIDEVSDRFGPIEQEWKVSRSEFGRVCLLKRKKRTLLYLTPEKDQITVAIVLGERVVGLALSSNIPNEIKDLIREARPYVEGRGIRFAVTSATHVPTLIELVNIKTTPKT